MNRSSALIAVFFLLGLADAQAQREQRFEFMAQHVLIPSERKAVYAVTLPLDDDLSCVFKDQRFVLHVREDLTGQQLLQALNTAGIGPVEWLRPPVVVLTKETFDDFPVLIDTGDPVHDEAVLGAAKEAWFAANPGALEIYRRQLEGHGPQER